MEWLRNRRKFQTVDLANYWLLGIDMLTYKQIAELVKGLSIDQKRHQKADIIDLRLSWALIQWENKKIQVVVGVFWHFPYRIKRIWIRELKVKVRKKMPGALPNFACFRGGLLAETNNYYSSENYER